MEASHDSQVPDRTEADDSARWEGARRSCVFAGRQQRCQDGQEIAKMACAQCANAVGFLEEADELGQALETLSDTAAQYWASVGRQGQIHLKGGFATFRLKPVLGETRMPWIVSFWLERDMSS